MEKFSVKKLYKDFSKLENQEITIEEWVKNLRDSKTFGFIELNDGTFFKNIQIVISDKLSNFKEVAKLLIYSTIKATGTLVVTENAKQPFEIQATNVEILSECGRDYPLQNKKHTMEYLRTIAHLRPRANTFQAVFRIRSVAAFVSFLAIFFIFLAAQISHV